MNEGARLSYAARDLIGVKFRLHGRNPQTGLDCVGLVAASLEAIGRAPQQVVGYRLRNTTIGRWLSMAEKSGLTRTSGAIEAGDVLLVKPGPGQHHLVIAENASTIIHAHAGLRRVVRQPRDTQSMPVIQWRLAPLREVG